MKKAWSDTWIDPVTGCEGFLVIDSIVHGLADGGLRMCAGVTMHELEQIAATMTVKCRTVGMRAGGAKGGINFSPSDPQARGVLARYMEYFREQLESTWITASDMGTSDELIRSLARELGLTSSIHAVQDKAKELRYHQALSLPYDGSTLGACVTGEGVVAAMRAIGDLRGARVSLQGFGLVGARIARVLAGEGAHVVAIADGKGLLRNDEGLPIQRILETQNTHGVVNRHALPSRDWQQVDNPDGWLQVDADYYVPAAVAGAINEESAVFLRDRDCTIVEAANIAVTERALNGLDRSRAFLIPDFIAGCGAVAIDAATLCTNTDVSAIALLDYVRARITEAVMDVRKLPQDQADQKKRASDFIMSSPKYEC